MRNYGGLADEFTCPYTSKIFILPVPYDGSSTWIKGADDGPGALIEASENMELYDIETDSEVFHEGIHTLKPLVCKSGVDQLVPMVRQQVLAALNKGKFLVSIGGEHSISIGAFQAVAERFNGVSFLQLDAHSDLRDAYKGSPYNHACVMARAKELGEIVQVGIRSMDISEKKNMQMDRVFFAGDIMNNNEQWHEQALEFLTEMVYLTIDLDVFDPSLVPSTGTPEPGGLNYYQVLNFLKKVISAKTVVGFDVVELCPQSGNKSPDFLAAKLIYQLLSLIFTK